MPPHIESRPGGLLVVSTASLVLGGLTSPAQGLLPDTLSSFANSVSGWTMLTAALVWLIAPRTGFAALLGPIAFVGLVLGYTIISQLRGFSYSPVLWGAVALLAGPFVGIAASWLRCIGWQAALGAGLLSGILFGDCCYGLTVVAATTHWLYWVLVGIIGASLLLVVLIRQTPRLRDAVAGVATALCTGTLLFLGYTVLETL